MKKIFQSILVFHVAVRLVCAFLVLTAIVGFAALTFGFPAKFPESPALCSGYSAALLLMLGFGVRGLRNR